jgi:hypothetical protein
MKTLTSADADRYPACKRKTIEIVFGGGTDILSFLDAIGTCYYMEGSFLSDRCQQDIHLCHYIHG